MSERDLSDELLRLRPGGISASLTTYTRSFTDFSGFSQGLTDGLDWNNMILDGAGNAVGSALQPTGFADNICVLRGSFTKNYFVEGTVHRAVGYTPSITHEIELLLRFNIGPHSAYGIEWTIVTDDENKLVDWFGALGSFNQFQINSSQTANDGDVFRAECVGNSYSFKKNGSLFATATDNNYVSGGQPGVGAFSIGGGGVNLASFGWQKIVVGAL